MVQRKFYYQKNNDFCEVNANLNKTFILKNGNEFVTLDGVDSVSVDLGWKLIKKQKYGEAINKYYASKDFRWVYNDKTFVVTEDKSFALGDFVFHNGEVWVALLNKSATKFLLTRTTRNGKKLYKWTVKKFCRPIKQL